MLTQNQRELQNLFRQRDSNRQRLEQEQRNRRADAQILRSFNIDQLNHVISQNERRITQIETAIAINNEEITH